MPETLSISIKNDLREIECVGRMIADFVAGRRLPPRIALDLNLALDEILTNVITHGYDDSREHRIAIRGGWMDGAIRLEVEDDGRPFDPLNVPEPDVSASLEDRSVGGLGVYLVRKLTDHLEYQRRDGKNVLSITKNAVQE